MAVRQRFSGTVDPTQNELGLSPAPGTSIPKAQSVLVLGGQKGEDGDPGTPGDQGDPGVSITDANVSSGRLLLTLSTGQVIDAGFVRGATGPAAAGASLFDSRSAIEGAVIPLEGLGGPNLLRTAGFDEPGDGGDAEYTRYSGTPNNFYSIIAGDYLSRPSRGYVQSADGQWWKLVTQGRPIKVECFGAKADYYIATYDTSDGGFEGGDQYPDWSINPSPTDNRAAIIEAIEFTPANKGGTTWVGMTVQLGYGAYYVSDTIDTYRSYCLLGMGLGPINNTSSQLVVAAGKMGFHFRSYGEGGRSISTLRHFGIYSLGHGGQTDKHGIDSRSRLVVEDVHIVGFGGDGILIAADVTSGSEASSFIIRDCFIWDNAQSGIHIYGGDANSGTTENCHLTANYYWAINDHGFLGNQHKGHTTQTNGTNPTATVNRGGPFRIANANARGSVVGCYSEGDQNPSIIDGPHSLVGGLHAAGVIFSNGAAGFIGQDWYGGLQFVRDGVAHFGLHSSYSAEPYSIMTFGHGSPNSLAQFDFKYEKYVGWGFKYGSRDVYPHDYSIVVSSSEWSWVRLPWVLPNHAFLPKGAYIGGVGSGASEDVNAGLSAMRHVWVNDDPLANTYSEHKLNDLALATDGKSLGRMCTTAGVKTTAWSSGTRHFFGAVVQTDDGHVYFLDREPYDPDAWPYTSTPGASQVPSTVPATHTSGAANYDETNTGINATEHPTLGYYTWVVVDESLYPQFDFNDPEVIACWEDYPSVTFLYPGAADTGSWMRNRTIGKTYACQAIPQQPTKLYDQTWSVPNNTRKPVHTSGSVDLGESNPDPSGSEPSDIPGYKWAYLHSNVTPAYARVGAPFYEGLDTFDFPSIASGARSSIRTVDVTGVRLGDHPRRIGCSVNLQGLEHNVWVSENDKMSYQLINGTGGPVDLGSATITLCADRSAQF